MKFRQYDGVLVCKTPGEDKLDMAVIEQIVDHTVNTWQRDRRYQETWRNTVQGKQAELAMETYLRKHTGLRYLSYDDFRADGFERHAPFDGLLYREGIPSGQMERCVKEINAEVAEDEAGRITPVLRQAMEALGVFPFEIKSSQMREKDYENVEHVQDGRTEQDYQTIASNLRRWDFFTYPHFLRTSDGIHSFYDYAQFVQSQEGRAEEKARLFVPELLQAEYDNASSIHTRLYFDRQTGELFFPGYITKDALFRYPAIGHMPGAKSGKALYYMTGIAGGKSFAEIDRDPDIWQYDRDAALAGLFARREVRCPDCGRRMVLCDARRARSYRYHCFNEACGRWMTMDEMRERGL